MDFSINCPGKVISTYIQWKCNDNLLPYCVFLKYCQAILECFHYFLMDSSKFATETNFYFSSFFLNVVWHMGFKFSRDISHIIFIITNGFQRTSELFYWTRFYLSFTEISEFGTDLNTGPMTRI